MYIYAYIVSETAEYLRKHASLRKMFETKVRRKYKVMYLVTLAV